MNFLFTDEQVAFKETLRHFFETQSSEVDVRRAIASSEQYDINLWRRVSHDLELTGLIIPDELGGSGGTQIELGLAFEEMGRSLACVPYFSTVGLGVNALLISGDTKAMERHLPRIASGECIATLAFAEEKAKWNTGLMQTVARRNGDAWLLDGKKTFVTDGLSADLIFVLANQCEVLSLFAVDGTSDDIVREPLRTLDETRNQAWIEFRSVKATLIGEEGDGARIIRELIDHASVAIAAEAVGGAQRVLEMAVDYGKTREQFGRPIGSFQAIKHMCADVLIEVESAKSAAYYAMWAATDDGGELNWAAPMAKSYCSEAFFNACTTNVQVHGAVGFTWENPAHLFLKRAETLEKLFGDSRQFRRVLMSRVWPLDSLDTVAN